jgi:peptidoglycan/LPS O-acetylase OafA/YrhL
VLALPRRWLVRLCAALIVVAPLWRLVTLSLLDDKFATFYQLPGVIDSLAAGALLAVLAIERPSFRFHPAIPAVAAVATASLNFFGLDTLPYGVLIDTLQIPVLAWAVWTARAGFGGVAGAALSSRPLVYLGRISYGIYVIHNFMPQVFHLVRPMPDTWLTAGIYTGLTLILAAASWRFLEGPMNRLKSRFGYRTPRPKILTMQPVPP